MRAQRVKPVPLAKYWRSSGVVPKGSDLSFHSEEDLDWVAAELNDRARKRLAFEKSIEAIEKLLLQ